MGERLMPRDQMVKMAKMLGTFRPENAEGDRAVIQCEITGDGGGNWYLTVDDGKCSLAEGISQAAGVTVRISAGDFVDLTTGKLDKMAAMMLGKMKVKGDAGLLMRMLSWFPQ
jgi:putative sterol carrier protein